MKYKCLEKLNSNNKKNHLFLKIMNKGLSAILIGLIALIVMEYSPKFKTFMNEEVLGKNISFGFIGNLYKKYFGNVLPTNSEDNIAKVFNEKISFSDIKTYENGSLLTVDKNYLIPAINSGVIVFIGEKDNLGKVIVVEQEDKKTVTYGHILNTSLNLYDYIEKGKFIGEVEDNSLYLSILEDNNYLDIKTYLSW